MKFSNENVPPRRDVSPQAEPKLKPSKNDALIAASGKAAQAARAGHVKMSDAMRSAGDAAIAKRTKAPAHIDAMVAAGNAAKAVREKPDAAAIAFVRVVTLPQAQAGTPPAAAPAVLLKPGARKDSLVNRASAEAKAGRRKAKLDPRTAEALRQALPVDEDDK